MKLKMIGFSILFLHFHLSSFATADEGQLIVHENAFKDRAYHHAALRLAPTGLLDGKNITDPEIGYQFSEGGLFEIYLTPESLGKMAQGCTRVIVRMPWTNPSASGSAQKIKAKKALFDQIERLRQKDPTQAQIQVILELDPYLSGNRVDGYELTQCLVFFRTAFGAYVAHPNALQ